LREEYRLRVFENWVLRELFGFKRDGVTGELRRRQDEKLYDLYSLLNFIRMVIFRRMRWVGHVVGMWQKYIRVLVENRGKETTWKT
jgi:hypothetical protein